MSDIPGDDRMKPIRSLSEALHALPQSAPVSSVWPELEARLRQSTRVQKRRGYLLPAALAAGLALLLMLPLTRQTGSPPSDVVPSRPDGGTPTASVTNSDATSDAGTDNAAGTTQVIALRQQSEVLEGWLSAARNSNTSARDLLASSEIEDMIGLVDVQLAASKTDNADAASLWRQRVVLLQDLAALRYTGASLAANGFSAESIAALPTVWMN